MPIAKELKVKPIKELELLLAEKREELRALRFKVAQRQLKNVSQVKYVKQDIARVLTLLKEKTSQS